MPKRISEALGISQSKLIRRGVFDGFVGVDSLLYIDPHLLTGNVPKELAGSHDRYLEYFRKVLKILRYSTGPKSRFFREAVKLLTFPEIPFLSLGYGENTNHGSGTGKDMAVRLAYTAKEIADAGIDDPSVFEIIGLLEEGVGADRISDMTACIIVEDLIAFTRRVCRSLKIKTRRTKVLTHQADLPVPAGGREPIIMIPAALLRSLPMSLSWDDVDLVSAENAILRAAVNATIGETWRQATSRAHVSKKDLRQTLLENPELIKDALKQYKAKDPDPYDLRADPLGEVSWQDDGREMASAFPLQNRLPAKPKRSDVLQVVSDICQHFANLVEYNGQWKLLYDDQGSLRHERYAQLLFFAVAQSYCKANDIDLSPESNAGRGHVDFKFSRGFAYKVNVEIKYSRNSGLRSGFERQLPAYDRAEQSRASIYLVLKVTKKSKTLADLEERYHELIDEGKRVPEIVFADAVPKESASKPARKSRRVKKG